MASETSASAERFYCDFAGEARQNPVMKVDGDTLRDFFGFVDEVVEGSGPNRMLEEIRKIAKKIDGENLQVSNGDLYVLLGLLCENASSEFDLYSNVRRFQDDIMVFSYPDPNTQATGVVLEVFDFLFTTFKSSVKDSGDIALRESVLKLQASREKVRTFTDLGIENGLLLGLVEHHLRNAP